MDGRKHLVEGRKKKKNKEKKAETQGAFTENGDIKL